VKQTLFEAENFSVVRELLPSSASGTPKETEYILQPDVVIAVPVHPNGHITLVRHIRPILKQQLLECPGGKVDPGESLEAAMTRELEEEVGLTPGKLEYVNYFFSSVGTSTEKIHVFIARYMMPHKRKAADTKRMQVVDLAPEDVVRVFTGDTLHDGKTIVALGAYIRLAKLNSSA
jgi:ADP-ribose pyrophosphatase